MIWFHFILLLILRACLLADDSLNSTQHVIDSGRLYWNKGFSLLDSGRLSAGLRTLDSLSTSDSYDLEAVSEYARKIFHFFCTSRSIDSSSNPKQDVFYPISDTLACNSYKYKIVSFISDSGPTLPSFGFNTSYAVQKPVQLSFKGLSRQHAPALMMNHEVFTRELDSDLMDQITDKSDSISCSIFIDLKNVTLTMHDYISEYVEGVFDSISLRTDLEKYNALSLRCYKRKNYSIENGKFIAIISFDRLFPDRIKSKGRTIITPLPVRYTVVVESAGAVRDLAEAKFQTILKTL